MPMHRMLGLGSPPGHLKIDVSTPGRPKGGGVVPRTGPSGSGLQERAVTVENPTQDAALKVINHEVVVVSRLQHRRPKGLIIEPHDTPRRAFQGVHGPLAEDDGIFVVVRVGID